MSINKDQVAGRIKEVSGAVKEAVGKAVGNDKVEIQGTIQKNTGLVQATLGDIKKDVTDSIKSA